MAEYLSFKPNSKLVTIFIAAAHFIIIAVGFFSFISYRNAASNLLIHQDSQLAFSSAVRLNKELEKYIEELTAIAHDPAILGNNYREKNERLQELVNRLMIFDAGAVLINHNGIVQAAVPYNLELNGQDWSDIPFFSEQFRSPRAYFSNAVQLQQIDKEVIAVSVPLLTSDNEFKGVLAGLFQVGSSSVSSFYASIVKLRIGLTGNTYILDGNRQLLYDSGGVDISDSRAFRKFEDMQLEDLSGAYRTRDGEGNQVIAAYGKVPDTDWVLIIEDDWRIINSPVRTSQNIILGFLGFGMILPAVSVAVLSRMRAREDLVIDSAQEEERIEDEIMRRTSMDIPPVIPGWEFSFPPNNSITSNFVLSDIFLRSGSQVGLTLAYTRKDHIETALNLNALRSLVQNLSASGSNLAAISRSVNQTFFHQLSEGQGIDLLLAHFDITTGRFDFCALGFPDILISGPDQASLKLLTFQNQRLGAAYEMDVKEMKLDFSPGTRMFFLIPDKLPWLKNHMKLTETDFSQMTLGEDFSSLDLAGALNCLQELLANSDYAGHQIFAVSRVTQSASLTTAIKGSGHAQ